MLKRSILTAWLGLALVFGLLWLRARLIPPAAPETPPAAALRVLHRGEVLTMPLEEYLVGVVAAEMPADFEPEALRAQAVAARSYTLYCRRSGRHADADVCTDSGCCQAWKSDEAMREGWGEHYAEKLRRVREAVEQTRGQYLRYGGEPAFAAFHSSSAGFTEDCGAIWSELPYLVSVWSPESAETVPHYVSTVTRAPLDFRDTLLAENPDADFSGAPETWLGETARDESGRVALMQIGGAAYTGVKLRALFGLRSTAFTLAYEDGVFRFTVTGFGHGVGMSQYGANVLAAGGADYQAILAHYYPGTELAEDGA